MMKNTFFDDINPNEIIQTTDDFNEQTTAYIVVFMFLRKKKIELNYEYIKAVIQNVADCFDIDIACETIDLKEQLSDVVIKIYNEKLTYKQYIKFFCGIVKSLTNVTPKNYTFVLNGSGYATIPLNLEFSNEDVSVYNSSLKMVDNPFVKSLLCVFGPQPINNLFIHRRILKNDYMHDFFSNKSLNKNYVMSEKKIVPLLRFREIVQNKPESIDFKLFIYTGSITEYSITKNLKFRCEENENNVYESLKAEKLFKKLTYNKRFIINPKINLFEWRKPFSKDITRGYYFDIGMIDEFNTKLYIGIQTKENYWGLNLVMEQLTGVPANLFFR